MRINARGQRMIADKLLRGSACQATPVDAWLRAQGHGREGASAVDESNQAQSA